MKNELEEGELANKIQKESYKVPVESLNPQPIAIAEPIKKEQQPLAEIPENKLIKEEPKEAKIPKTHKNSKRSPSPIPLNRKHHKDQNHKSKAKKHHSRHRSRSHEKKNDKHKKNSHKHSNSRKRSKSHNKRSKSRSNPKKTNKIQDKKDSSIKKNQNQEINQELDIPEIDNFTMEIEKEHNEAQLIEERRKKRQEMMASFQKNNEKSEKNHENSHNETEKHQDEIAIIKKPSASKTDIEQYNYIKMVDAMREKNLMRKEEEKVEKNEISTQEKAINSNNPDMFDMFNDTLVNLETSLPTNLIKPDILEWDDEDHYYKVQIGEILDKQYQIVGKCGKGVFSNVVRAVHVTTKQSVAIKIIRSDEMLMRAGQREVSILQKLNESDKFDKKHVIKLYGSFEYRRHLCLVFEPMDQDLRETLKIFGKKIGLSLDAVRSYATQIFLALSHLKKNKIIHADLKPDNILATNNSKTIKLCDFGTAMNVDENSLVEYLVSRYYRAPEIILGYPYSTSIDMWSAACTIYEIYVGTFLFPGRNNNEMIKLIMQTKGKFNNKILKRGEFVYKYLDTNYNFLSMEIDPITKQEYVKAIPVNDKPIRDLGLLLNIYEGDLTDKKILLSLKDLLDKCLCLDPAKRMTPEEALKHPFISQLTGGDKQKNIKY